MDIDRLLAEADPARSISIPGPDSPEARQALGRLTKAAPGRRRMQFAVSVAAACVAVAAGIVVAIQAGIAPFGGGALAPVTVSPPVVPPLPSVAPALRTGLPSAALVGKAMLTAYSAAARDIIYQREIGVVHGRVMDEYQIWDWPAQPVFGQRALERDRYAQRTPASVKALTLVEDSTVVYTIPWPATRSETLQVTDVCYPGTGGCGWGGALTPNGTWSRASIRSAPMTSALAPGEFLNPATIAHGIIAGQWRVVGRTRLGGQPAIELSETSKGKDRLLPLPVLLWVNARTYLPIRCTSGVGSASVSEWDYAYLPPTPANLALLRVPIPRGYPRSNPFAG
jgi:hypothetical protein